MKVSYPKWMYHPEEKALIVESAEEMEALGDEWEENPFEPAAPKAPKKSKRDSAKDDEA